MSAKKEFRFSHASELDAIEEDTLEDDASDELNELFANKILHTTESSCDTEKLVNDGWVVITSTMVEKITCKQKGRNKRVSFELKKRSNSTDSWLELNGENHLPRFVIIFVFQ